MGHAVWCPTPIAPLVCGPLGAVGPGAIGASIVSALLGALTSWLSSIAAWLLSLVGALLGRSTVPPVNAGWFVARQRALITAAAPIALLALVGGALHALLHGSIAALVRTVCLRLPVAVLLGGAAAGIVGVAVSASDVLTASLAGTAGSSLGGSLHTLAVGVGATGPASGAVAALAAGLVALGALVLWFELVVRAAAITIATALLPLVLATTLWPPAVVWARRLAETLGALIVAKPVIVLVLSLALDAIAHASAGPSTALTGAAMLLLASFMPFGVLRLMPMVEAAAVGHLEAVRHRATSTVRQAGGRAVTLALSAGAGSAVPSVDPVGSDPVGMLEGIDVDPIAGSALDPETAVVRGPPPTVAVPASAGRHVWERDEIGPRLVWKPPWDDPGR